MIGIYQYTNGSWYGNAVGRRRRRLSGLGRKKEKVRN
jgi:hypothetical protein